MEKILRIVLLQTLLCNKLSKINEFPSYLL